MSESERTNVIVVGAGASQEFNLPTGAELTSIIQKDLSFKHDMFGDVSAGSGDFGLKKAIKKLSHETGVQFVNYVNAAEQICRNMALAPSIDNYLDTHKDNQELVSVGKLAIANAIIKAENRSSLTIDSSNIYNRLDFTKNINTWAAVFFKVIVAKRDYVSFLAALRNITFVSFNYDRCIKQYFVNAAASYFELDGPRIEEVLDALEVIHPYGSIGEIRYSGERVAGYGLEVNVENIYNSSKRIRTFTEGVADPKLLEGIRGSLGRAELVIFLGFSFIDINMKILKPDTQIAKRVLATAKGRSEDTRMILRNQLERDFTGYNRQGGKSVEMFNGKCFELFYEFDNYLASS
ncbi:hypothetical protein [Sulfitobacter sp.]|uniref:hypothetical protein n=1 Tax=Sulfitobacter sp. TaxID=1903071 RepID=UPI003003060F